MAPVGVPLEVRKKPEASHEFRVAKIKTDFAVRFSYPVTRNCLWSLERCSYSGPELSVTMLANMTLPGNNDVAA